MSLTDEMVGAMLSTPLRSLRLERLELTEEHPFWRLLDVPDLEELVLGRRAPKDRATQLFRGEVNIPESRKDCLEVFLGRLRHLVVLSLGPGVSIDITKVVQQNSRSLRKLLNTRSSEFFQRSNILFTPRLRLTGLDAKSLLCAIERCSRLESLTIKAEHQQKACLDFDGTMTQLALKASW